MAGAALLSAHPASAERVADVRVIGLTGGIASGKSLVSGQLRRLGATVIDADSIARAVVAPGGPAREAIIREFGGSVVSSEGSLDRKALGDLVFHDPLKLQKLNRITHPLILAEIDRLVQQYRTSGSPSGDSPSGDVVVLEAPLLFETGLEKSTDEVWVVHVDPETQIRRLMERDRLTEQEARSRILLQIPLEEKVRRAGRVIDNRGRPEETERQVREAWRSVVGG
jgi:dephospho-CoA kinase